MHSLEYNGLSLLLTLPWNYFTTFSLEHNVVQCNDRFSKVFPSLEKNLCLIQIRCRSNLRLNCKWATNDREKKIHICRPLVYWSTKKYGKKNEIADSMWVLRRRKTKPRKRKKKVVLSVSQSVIIIDISFWVKLSNFIVFHFIPFHFFSHLERI